ncbi:V-type proton ATPase subunit S1 [Anthonomus grandis grandis]|uniref:V-type proton ATPase subunit S1 n=1 Tax=Anthonomus grandis grandis TaxID=2921223 RepID=UPI002165CB68|nr:V-type proton ATPase subunit S1 [Anthonomus grandis grandis]
MGFLKSILSVVSFLVLAQVCLSEYVPVYMWGTQRTSEPVPALHKVSSSSFKEEVEHRLKETPRIVIFAEHSLSPEDLAQRDRQGNNAYPYLSKIHKSSKVTYFTSVQNPLKAIQHAADDVVTTSIERLKDNFEVPEGKIVIIELNDATESERRFDLLKRHDSFIGEVYQNLLKNNDDILALYTAHHASWIGSGETHSRKSRSLMAETETQDTENGTMNILMNNSSILFYTSAGVSVWCHNQELKFNMNYTAEEFSGNDTKRVLQGTGINGTVTLNITADFYESKTGYWYMQLLDVMYGDNTDCSFNKTTNSSVYAPIGFSYACNNQTFKSVNSSLSFSQFQVEPRYNNNSYWTKQNKFNDPYHCVGFTTIPIWSGLFVTFILLLIMSFGLTMMMDIKTMDRFDDAKGKTITINASE